MNKKVLLVDDNLELAKVIANRLQQLSFEIEIASSWNEGLEKINTINPDLLILDIQLPDISGLEVAKKLVEQDQFKNLPILFISGKIAPDQLELPPNDKIDFISKPFKLDKLTKKIETLLKL